MNSHVTIDPWIEALKLRERNRGVGRPRTASDDLRLSNYKDANGQYQLSSLKPWHERIVDFMLLRPNARIVDIAREFNVTPMWIGELMGADMFKEYYHKRMSEHRQFVQETVVAKMQGVAVKAIDRMAEKLDQQADMPMGEVRDTAALMIKSLGFGVAPAGKGVQVNVQTSTPVVVGVSQTVIAAARERMAAVRRENTLTMVENKEGFQHVTAQMELEAGDVEDADVVVGGIGSESSEE